MKFRVRPAVEKDESLASYLVRLSRANRYGTPFAARKIWGQYMEAELGYQDNLKLPSEAITAWAFYELTGIEMTTLFGMTAHRFAAGILPPEQVIMQRLSRGNAPLVLFLTEQQLTRHLRAESSAAYCPLCLQEAHYHRVQWQPQVITICHEHKCFLSDVCSGCNTPVGVVDVVRGRCRKCSKRLTAAPVEYVEENSVEYAAQRTLYSWLNRDGSEDRLSIPVEEITEPLNALYYVLLGLRACLMRDTRRLVAWGFPVEKATPRRVERSALGIQLHSRLLAGAFKALQDWPTNFYAFLDVIRTGQDEAKSGLPAFGNLYARHLAGNWVTFSYLFIQQAFNDYMAREPELCASLLKSRRFREHPNLIEKLPFVTQEGAAEILKVASPTVGALIEEGTLRRYNQTASRFVMLNKAEVEALNANWNELLMLFDVSIQLGIWHEAILDLVDEGLLAGRKGIGRGGVQEWGFQPADVEGLIQTVSSCVVRGQDDSRGGAVDLERAVQRISILKFNTARLLKAVLEGKITAHVVADKWRLCDLMFYIDDLEQFSQRVLLETGWMTRAGIARRMGVKDTVVAKWVLAGLLSPVATVANAAYFATGEVDQFIADHVFTEEAATILDMGVLSVQKWARIGRLHPVAGTDEDGCHRYLFRRGELEQLRPENRLTAPQLAEKLGISRSTLSEWMRQGKLTPISGPEIDGSKHYLFLKDNLDQQTGR